MQLNLLRRSSGLESAVGLNKAISTAPSVSTVGGVAVTTTLSSCSPSISRSLTTIFTPPAGCSTQIFSVSTKLEFFPYQRSACYPSSIWAVFSPGLCPTGYTVGLGVHNVYLGCSAQTTAPVTETQFYCCPSGLSFNPLSTTCVATINTPFATGNPPTLVPASVINMTEIILPSTISTTNSLGTNAVSTIATAITTSLVTSGPLTIYAPPFYVRYQSTDSAVSSSWASIIARSAAELSSSSAGATTTSTSAANGSSSISGGAIAGIVIGVIAALLILLGVVLFVLKKRRQQRQAEAAAPAVGGEEKDTAYAKQELSAEPVMRAELDNEKKTAEMSAGQYAPPAELQGNGKSSAYEMPGGEQHAPVELHGDHVMPKPQELGDSQHVEYR